MASLVKQFEGGLALLALINLTTNVGVANPIVSYNCYVCES